MKICPDCKATAADEQEYCVCGHKFENIPPDFFQILRNPAKSHNEIVDTNVENFLKGFGLFDNEKKIPKK